ncbi:histidine kinase [Kitasatospora sp. NPDC048540]|uniref:sensor histidine kinase n=1 Tax=unclassified Kitasatospora TaxID=2633591 RepID=UPI0013142DD2|nr:histidine kinase [Kitasatospora sp. MBT63]
MPKPIPSHRPVEHGEEGRGGGAFATMPGAPVDGRRQLVVKLSWMSLWMVYLVYPVQDLVRGGHGTAAVVAGSVALAAFVTSYLALVAIRTTKPDEWSGKYGVVAAMLVIAVVTSITLGQAWLTLFTYASVCVAVVLPTPLALRGVAGVTVLALVIALLTHADGDTLFAILLPCFLSGLAMTGLQRLVSTMKELREARATVAHLAASEERLRLARDLHDLLGHSLSLITIKSELAGRFMDQDKQEEARTQVADIEKVARQSLIDVREAVSGFRRPTLAVELAAARTALATSQITLEAAPAVAEGHPALGAEEAGALAWALRESVTNIVRHGAGASRCTVTLDEVWEGDGERFVVLEITDDGRGPGKSGPGNGLSGLGERLQLVGGRLESGAGERGRGFRLRALVPLRTVAAGTADSLPK